MLHSHRTMQLSKSKAEIYDLFEVLGGNTFQNLMVSSPDPVTILSPSGDIARYNTR